MPEQIIIVDEQDNQIGLEKKLYAHQKGLLHRAISVFIFNSKNELLLQQRAINKYHCGGLWSNSCCTHPKPEESVENAAHRRLYEEMGIKTNLEKIGTISYKIFIKENNLHENELDHLFIGNYEANPQINPDEVSNFKWISLPVLLNDISSNSKLYTPWFKIILPKILIKLPFTI